MKPMRLTKEEKKIEADLIRGVYVPVSKEEFLAMKAAIERRRKDAVLNIRVNKDVLDSLKHKAKKLGVPYQTFIAEILHRNAA